MSQQRIFGTDGVRGRAGEGWLSADGVATIGLVAGEVLAGAAGSDGSLRRVLLGHDGRHSGPALEVALARGFAAGGLEPVSAGLISTPGLALLARLGSFDLAAMISASHNPADDNGVKLLSGNGEKLSDAMELAIEERLHDGIQAAPEGPTPRHDPELEMQYLRYLVEQAGAGLALDGMSVVIDCANGGASRVAPRVFGRLGAHISAIHSEPDGDNINRGCGSTEPEDLQAEVRKQGAHVGIALDGDGDRCILVDEAGHIVHGDGILTICATHAAASGRLPVPTIVATVMSNKGLHRALREAGVGVETVDVGDRNVVERMRAEGLSIGGEQSGHVVFGEDHFFIGDGIYTALAVLRVMKETGKPLSELAAPYQPFPQVLVNVRVAQKPVLAGIADIAQAVARIETELGEDGRVLLRYSGTEPLARVMIEGPDAQHIQGLAQNLAGLIETHIGE
jgi:phosphoglucosamine mutase